MGMFDDLIPGGEAPSGRPQITVTPRQREPRGIRNNNFGNIEDGPFARSQPGYKGSDGRFAVYDSPDAGAAAMDSLLASYGRRGVNTPEAIVGRWAPASDGNPVSAYASHVAGGGDPRGQLDMNDPAVRSQVAQRMAQFENGKPMFMAPKPAPAPSPANPAPPQNMFADLIPSGGSFEGRFTGEPGPGPQNPDALQAGLEGQARGMTTGEPTNTGQKLAIDFLNQGSAAGQGTTSIIDAQRKNLISTDVYQSDAGEVLFKDPATGQVIPTDQNKHVVLRDPADNVLKVFARTANTDEGRLSSMGRIAMTGMAAGAPTARPAVPVMKAVAPSRNELLTASKQGFEQFKSSGAQVPGQTIKGLSQEIAQSLNTEGFLDVLAPKTHGVLAKLEAAPEGSIVTAQQLHAIRRVLGTAAKSTDPTEKAAASIAMQKFDEFLGAIPETKGTLDDAIGNYATAKRSERVSEAVGKSQRQAGSAGSGSNIDNATRQQIKSILNSPNKLRGFSSEEVDAMEKIVRGTFTGNAARLIGKLAPTGIVSSGLSGGAGFVVGGPLGAVALPAAGFAGKKLADTLTKAQVAKLDELVRSRSPLAKSVGKSLETWSKVAEEVGKNPSPPKLAMFALASRNLVNNLKDAGISASAADFIKALQGPVRSAAEDEQP